MNNLKTIEEAAKTVFGSFRQYCIQTEQEPRTFKKCLANNFRKIEKVNKWIAPLGFKLILMEKV